MIEYPKLKKRLEEIEAASEKEIPIDPTRGLSGELLKKMVAGLAGHRSGNLTEAEKEEIRQIQAEYDQQQ